MRANAGSALGGVPRTYVGVSGPLSASASAAIAIARDTLAGALAITEPAVIRAHDGPAAAVALRAFRALAEVRPNEATAFSSFMAA